MTNVGGGGKAAVALQVNRGNNAPEGAFQPQIVLQSPVADLIPGFTFANCKRKNIEMVGPQDSRLGKVLALCGAGPSLRMERMDPADEVWACNSALTYLLDNGIRDLMPRAQVVGVAIDQTPQMLEEWVTAPDVLYYLASTTDPKLCDHLEAQGRSVRWFHNAVGFKEGLDVEFKHYDEDWPPTFTLGMGATVVPRLIALGAWLGFRRIDVYGADCAFAEGDVVHANGGTASAVYGNPVIMEGKVRGRMWRTRPDLLMSAVDLARQVAQNPGHIRLIGDTLPVALMGLADDQLDAVMQRVEPGKEPTTTMEVTDNGQ